MSKRIAIAILTSCFLVACGGGNEANTSKDTPVSENPTTTPVNGGTDGSDNNGNNGSNDNSGNDNDDNSA